MRKILILSIFGVILFLNYPSFAQTDAQKLGKQYFEVGEMFRWGQSYDKRDYKKAVRAYQLSATYDYPDGIMALGEMYQFGLGGLDKNYQMAFRLITKAYSMGSGRACYNLGKSYAFGLGCEVDYSKMILYLNEGIKRDDAASMYAMGNMMFKGWGIEQNYEKAVQWFEKAASKGSLSAKYYLGICYRNGYGVTKDTQKAKILLEDASLMCFEARKELKRPTPEVEAAKKVKDKEFDAPTNFKAVKHSAKTGSLNGEWSGHLVFYDWSGKTRLDEMKVDLTIKTDGEKFEGTWSQDGTSFTINGLNNQYGIVFSSGEFDYQDFYMDKVKVKINNGSFETFEQGNKTILAGSVSLFSITEKEPERPAYLVLNRKNQEKKQEKSSIVAEVPKSNPEKAVLKSTDTEKQTTIQNSGNEKSFNEQMIDRVQETTIVSRVWPVPFKNKLSVEYNLKNEGETEIRLVSIDGRLMGVLTKENRSQGKQTQHFNVNVPTGTYILQIISGERKTSHIIICE